MNKNSRIQQIIQLSYGLQNLSMKSIPLLKRLFSILFFCCLLINFSCFSQEVYRGSKAANLFSNAEIVRTSKHSTLPSYIKFQQSKELDLDLFKTWIKSSFKLDAGIDFKLVNIEKDQLGYEHYRYQQTLNGRPITCHLDCPLEA